MTPGDPFGIQQFGGSNGSDLASPGRLEGLRPRQFIRPAYVKLSRIGWQIEGDFLLAY